MTDFAAHRGFPRCCWYNIRYLGLSDPGLREKKIANIRALCARNCMVGISEVHASAAVAVADFFCHIPNITPLYLAGGGDHIILIDTEFFERHAGMHKTIFDGCAHAVSWSCNGVAFLFVSLRLDAHDPRRRRIQLIEIQVNIGQIVACTPHCRIAIGGDRNFVTCSSERHSSRASV